MWFFLPDATVKFQDASLSPGVAVPAVKHRGCAQGGGTAWLSSFLTPCVGKSYSLPFPDRRAGHFWGLPGIAAASCDVNNRWHENPCPAKREQYSVVQLSCCTETLSWEHPSSHLQLETKQKHLIRNKSSPTLLYSDWRYRCTSPLFWQQIFSLGNLYVPILQGQQQPPFSILLFSFPSISRGNLFAEHSLTCGVAIPAFEALPTLIPLSLFPVGSLPWAELELPSPLWVLLPPLRRSWCWKPLLLRGIFI